MIGDHLRTHLLAQATITNITSNIYAVILPSRPTYPAITYRETDHYMEETLLEQTTFTDSDFIFDAWATTYAGAKTLSDAIRAVLKNLSGTVDTITINRTVLSAGPEPYYEESVEAYRISQTFTFTHNEG